MIPVGVGNSGCMIAYPAEGYKKDTLKYAVKLGIDKVVLLEEDRHYVSLFDSIGLNTSVKPVSTDDINLVISSVVKLILDLKREHDFVNVLLLPSDPLISVGTYIAGCMEKVKIHTPASDIEKEYLSIPIFPFVNLNKNEEFVLTKIMENDGIDTKSLLKAIKKEKKRGYIMSQSFRSKQ